MSYSSSQSMVHAFQSEKARSVQIPVVYTSMFAMDHGLHSAVTQEV